MSIKYLITLWSADWRYKTGAGLWGPPPSLNQGSAWRDGSSSQDIWWDINIITIDHTHLKWVHDSPLAQAIIVIIRCWISINEFLVAACRCWVTDIMSRALTQCWVDCCDHIHYTVHGRSPADTTRRVKTFWYSSVLIFTTGLDLPSGSVRMQKLMLWVLWDTIA